MAKIFNLQWKRRLIQAASLVVIGEFSFYGIFRCPFAVPYVSCGNCPVIQCPGRKLWWGFWIALLITTILFGKAFCGWACPGGILSELFEKIAFLKRKINGKLDKILNLGKYVVLAGSLIFFIFMNNPRWAIPIRTGEFFNAVSLTFEHANMFWLAKTIFILVGFGLGALIPYFWCRYLCPTGGALELVKRFSIFRYFKTESCNECDKCRIVCGLETRPDESNCTNCGECDEACPVNAIKFGGIYKKSA